MSTEGTRGEVPEQPVFEGIVDELCAQFRVCGLAASVLRRAESEAVLIVNYPRAPTLAAGLGRDGLRSAVEARLVLEWEPGDGELLVDAWYDVPEGKLEEAEPLAVAGIADDLYRYVVYYVLGGEEDGNLEVHGGVRRAVEGLEMCSLTARRETAFEAGELRDASERCASLGRLAADVLLMTGTVGDWLEQLRVGGSA